MGDVIKEWIRNPDNRTKVFLALNMGVILTNFLISFGALIFVLKVIGYF
ncbi:MAG: hypothetical protein V3R86_04880 [Candidatus Hydrothermarchaeaceae archaeon]